LPQGYKTSDASTPDSTSFARTDALAGEDWIYLSKPDAPKRAPSFAKTFLRVTLQMRARLRFLFAGRISGIKGWN
jgi:hypothetical protein